MAIERTTLPQQGLSSLTGRLPSQLPEQPNDYGSLARKFDNDMTLDYLNLDRASVRQGLAQHLGGLNERLQQQPETLQMLRQSPLGEKFLAALDRAAQGHVSENEIADIQGLLVGAGIDIHNDYDGDGVDGAYGAATHRGLDELTQRLRGDTQELGAALLKGQSVAEGYVNETRQHLAAAYAPSAVGFPEREEPTRPGQPVEVARRPRQQNRTSDAQEQTRTAGYSVNYASPAAAQRGQALATRANRVAGSMGGSNSTGRCYVGVKRALQNEISLTGASAYMAAGQLARSPRFREATGLRPADLRTLPPGAVVVWGKTKASPDGHISVALGNGREASDYRGTQMTSLRGATNFRVFLPN